MAKLLLLPINQFIRRYLLNTENYSHKQPAKSVQD